MKKCKVCLEEKELNLFDKVSKSGYRGTCRKCRNTKNRKSWLSNEKNIEKRRKYMKNYMREKYHNNEEYRRYHCLLSKLSYKLKNDIRFREKFELKFDENMNWDNKGIYWEIDHINSALKMIKNGYSDEEINDIRNVRPLTIKQNRERVKKDNNEYVEYKEPISQKKYRKKYYQKNKEQISKKNKIWYQENKERLKYERDLKNLSKN